MNKVNILGFCAIDIWDSIYVIKKAVNWTLTPNQGPLGVSNEPI